MATGVVPGVLALPSADALPLPAPPGVVIVTTPDVERTARQLCRLLGAGTSVRPVEARSELERRREVDVRVPRAEAQRRRSEATAARSAAEAARQALSFETAALDPGTVRRAARAVADAAEALETARATLGARPPLDASAASAARQAQADLEQAQAERYSGLPQANSWLAMANGGATLLVAGRLVSEAFDPAFFLVALLPLAALAFTASTILSRVGRCRAAARRRWTALRSLDVCTMAGLAALEARAEAWSDRLARLAEAEAELRKREDAWRLLSGEDTPVSGAERLAADLEAVASLDALATRAATAWARSAVELQQAEDLAGRGHPPLVVVDTRTSARAETRRRTVEELSRLAGTASVVVVHRRVPESRNGADVPSEPTGAPSHGAVVVDLRERVLAGLQRLRSRSARPSGQPPGSVAAGG